MDSTFILAIWAASACVTALLCWKAMVIGRRFNLLDVPDERKIHSTATPLMGGVVLLGAFLPLAILMALQTATSPRLDQLLIWISVAAALALVGIADDRHSLSPRLRLLLSFLIFGAAAYFEPIYNVRLLDFEHPRFSLGLGTRGIAIFFTVVCSVGLVNAVNMADGKNGLVIGLCMGWLGLLAMRAPPHFLPLIGILLSSLLVLLAFNLKGRLFLGDGGAYGMASAIGVLAIAIYNSPGDHATRAISAGEVMLMFAVPVFDSFRLTYKRWRRGQSPMAADRDHLHHHLLDQFGWPLGLILYWLVALGPAFLYFMH
jgi:UDP-GlcNAc:undecaprenyl-phosphate/decaprenyl-phosphate GlcNAc-1-phosphate transferase